MELEEISALNARAAVLREDVSSLQADVQRLRALMIKAVWKGIQQYKRRADDPSAGRVRGAAGLSRTRRAPGSGAGARASSASSPPRQKPFLPPDRFPELPPLEKEKDFSRLNRTLVSAVLTADRVRGAVQSGSGGSTREKPSAWVRALTRAAAEFGCGGSAPGPSPPPVSTASSAAAAAAAVARPKVGAVTPAAAAAQRQKEAREAAAEAALLAAVRDSSVSLLVLSIAVQRSTATLVLRVMQLGAVERRARLLEADIRHDFYLSRRLLRAWRTAASAAARRRVRVTSVVVAVWQQAVRQSRERRQILRHFRAGLRSRALAFEACCAARRSRCFEIWRARFTTARVARAMSDAAESFRAARHDPAGALPPLLPYSGPVAVSGAVATAASPAAALPTSERFVAYRVLCRWRLRAERRLEGRMAAAHYQHTLLRRALARWREAFVHHPPPIPQAAAATAAPAMKEIPVPDDDAALPTSVTRRPPVVAVAAGACPAGVWRYRRLCAAQVGAGAVVARCFGRWQSRFRERLADRAYIAARRRQCFSVWIVRTSARAHTRAVQAAVMLRWRVALMTRRETAAAQEFQAQAALRRCWGQWRQRLALSRAVSLFTVGRLFRRWRTAALLRAAERERAWETRRAAFARWRGRAEGRFRLRTLYLAATTVRETVLLACALQVWRGRFETHRRARLSLSVFCDAREEMLRRRCFERWKCRVFGPSPQQLRLP